MRSVDNVQAYLDLPMQFLFGRVMGFLVSISVIEPKNELHWKIHAIPQPRTGYKASKGPSTDSLSWVLIRR